MIDLLKGISAAPSEGIEAQIRAELTVRQRAHDDAQRDAIGQFHFPKGEPGSLTAQHRDLYTASARARLDAARTRCNQGVAKVIELLQEHSYQSAEPLLSSPRDDGGPRISYAGYQKVMAMCRNGDEFACPLLRPDLFLALSKNSEGTVALQDIADSLHTGSHRLVLWAQAASFDRHGNGQLSQADVEHLLSCTADRLGYLPPEPLQQHWRIIAPRKIWFLLARGAAVPLKALIASEVMEDATSYDPASPQPTRCLDWFAPEKSAAIVQRFKELRGDNESFMLFPHQLMDVRPAPAREPHQPPLSSMTRFFVDRLFEVHVHACCPVTGQPAMSLAEFADFLLAWNYRGHAPSTKYFFRVLDVENAGRLTAAVIDMWCAHVRTVAVDEMDAIFDYDPKDVKDEVFDMVMPKNPAFITFEDLMACKLSDTICGILVDGQCHYEYDQREALQQQAQEEY